jgi:hypothetical protein
VIKACKLLEEVNMDAFASKLSDREDALTPAQLFDALHKEGTSLPADPHWQAFVSSLSSPLSKESTFASSVASGARSHPNVFRVFCSTRLLPERPTNTYDRGCERQESIAR